ncbi:MAG TPA: hypothetical protein VM143_00515 [Acidimicrobiales bacterium]|nr:hypothetical protein [Acidimicrobiales bacterium]
MNRRAATTAMSTVAFVVLGACGGGGGGGDGGSSHEHAHEDEMSLTTTTQPAFATADATTTLDVTLQDYAFVGVPDSLVGPNVLIKASIKGSNTHELELVDANGKTIGEIPPFEAGTATGTFVLVPGTYTVQCTIKEGARTHADLGMRRTITVTAS